jgi:post-segregation antitoxin (ccd killing protein)
MTAARVTITVPAELERAARDAAERAGVPFSTVVSEALAAWLRGRLVDAWLAEHQATHGTFDEDELRALAESAGVPYVPARRGRSAA